MPFTYDRLSQRYRNKTTGKFISEAEVRSLTEKTINQVAKDIKTIGNLLADGKISVATWETETAQALKTLHIWDYALGRGGVKRMSYRDYGILGDRLKYQYSKLRRFSNEIINKGMSRAQFERRLAMYIRSARGSFELGREESHARDGFNWEKRLRTKQESCSACILYASRGWAPVGSLPAPSEACECGSQCGCYKVYAKGVRPTDSMVWMRYGWLGQGLKQSLAWERSPNSMR